MASEGVSANTSEITTTLSVASNCRFLLSILSALLSVFSGSLLKGMRNEKTDRFSAKRRLVALLLVNAKIGTECGRALVT